MEYEITEDTKGCLYCGHFFEAKRSDAIFCSKDCNNRFQALPPEDRYLNPPIVNRKPLSHGDLYTSHGQEMRLAKGILRVRLRFQDPEVLAKEKKDEHSKGRENGETKERFVTGPKRRGS